MSNTSSSAKQRREDNLRPAFSSKAQAFYFLLLVIFALVLPGLISKSGLISRRDSYRIMPENKGAFSFKENEIFENQEDIDILFLGSSIIFSDIDTPQVQKALSDVLGRPARVVTFGNYFNGIDTSYMVARDLLERKRVRLVVFTIPRVPFTEGPSITGSRFIRYDDDKELFNRLPLRSKISLYASSVLRSPHDLLTLVRQNRSKPSPFAKDLGADKEDLGMGRSPEKFKQFSPPSPVFPVNDLIYTSTDQEQFQFTNEEIPPHQYLYLESLIELFRRKGVSVALVNLPMYSERHSSRIIERKDWSRSLGMEIPVIGVPPAVLFAGLSEEDIEKLYYDEIHMNTNGNEFFTRSILPAILEIYEKRPAKNY